MAGTGTPGNWGLNGDILYNKQCEYSPSSPTLSSDGSSTCSQAGADVGASGWGYVGARVNRVFTLGG